MFPLNTTSTTHIHTLSLHDALPISQAPAEAQGQSSSTVELQTQTAATAQEAHVSSARDLFVTVGKSLVVDRDRKSTRLNSSHRCISYAVFCLKKKKKRIAI